MIVPCTTPIKRNRVGNIDASRLCRRHQYLMELLITNRAGDLSTRLSFTMRAAEMWYIEAELMKRGLVNHRQLMTMRDHAGWMAPL